MATVKQLLKKLSKLPPNAKVYISVKGVSAVISAVDLVEGDTVYISNEGK